MGPAKKTYFDWEHDGLIWDDHRDSAGHVNLNQLNIMDVARLKHILFCGLDTKHNPSHRADKAVMLSWFKGLESNMDIRVRPRGVDRGFVEFDDKDLDLKNFRVRSILLIMEIPRKVESICSALLFSPRSFYSGLFVGLLIVLLWECEKKLWNYWM